MHLNDQSVVLVTAIGQVAGREFGLFPPAFKSVVENRPQLFDFRSRRDAVKRQETVFVKARDLVWCQFDVTRRHVTSFWQFRNYGCYKQVVNGSVCSPYWNPSPALVERERRPLAGALSSAEAQ